MNVKIKNVILRKIFSCKHNLIFILQYANRYYVLTPLNVYPQ